MAKKGLKDIYKIMMIMFSVFGIMFLVLVIIGELFSLAGYVDNPGSIEPIDIKLVDTDQVYRQSVNSLEMQKLIDFLHVDTTNQRSYNLDSHRGVNYYVCTGYTRDLAKNANEAGISMGGIGVRDTMGYGAATRVRHAMNYCIVDGKFLIIEPQADKIYTLEDIKVYHPEYKYITIFPNAQMISNYRVSKLTIDIDVFGEYDESKIVEKFPPL